MLPEEHEEIPAATKLNIGNNRTLLRKRNKIQARIMRLKHSKAKTAYLIND
jgi:hypothetical protein